MNQKELQKKLLKKEKAEFISEIKYQEKTYIKALKANKKEIEYVYYEIENNKIIQIGDEELLQYFKEQYEIKPSKIIY